MPGRRAGSTFAVYARVQCREPKTGQEKAQFYCEDDSLFLSSYYLFIYGLNNGPPTDYLCFRFFVKRIQFFYCCPLHIKPITDFPGFCLAHMVIGYTTLSIRFQPYALGHFGPRQAKALAHPLAGHKICLRYEESTWRLCVGVTDMRLSHFKVLI